MDNVEIPADAVARTDAGRCQNCDDQPREYDWRNRQPSPVGVAIRTGLRGLLFSHVVPSSLALRRCLSPHCTLWKVRRPEQGRCAWNSVDIGVMKRGIGVSHDFPVLGTAYDSGRMCP